MGSTYQPLRMYGQPSTNAPLEWAWVERQLTGSETYWVDVAGSAARPHPRPVWGVWVDGRLHLSIGTPAIRRAAKPGAGASVHLPDGLDVVIVEGSVAGPTTRPDVIAAYNRQHRNIYNALHERDAQGAYALITEHLEQARDDLVKANSP